MDMEEHIRTAREFLDKSEQEFAVGDILQASEKLWGAVAHTVIALAQQRGWRYGSHNELIQAARRLSWSKAMRKYTSSLAKLVGFMPTIIMVSSKTTK